MKNIVITKAKTAFFSACAIMVLALIETQKSPC